MAPAVAGSSPVSHPIRFECFAGAPSAKVSFIPILRFRASLFRLYSCVYAIFGISCEADADSMPKRLIFVADTHRVLTGFPRPVQQHIGYALYQAQAGEKHVDAKPLKNLGPGVLEIVSDHRGDTFRAVYTVKLTNAVYALHAFQKKSKHGIATPKAVMDLILQRLQRALEIDKELET